MKPTVMSSIKTRAESARTAFPSMLETLWAPSEAEETHSLKHDTGVDLIMPDVGISNVDDVSAIYDKGKGQYDKFVNDVSVDINRRFLYSKQVSHSSAHSTLCVLSNMAILMTMVWSPHTKSIHFPC